MGVHIHAVGLDDARDTRWDWIRHAGDREFAAWLGDHSDQARTLAEEWVYRPKDFAEARAWIQEHISQWGEGNLRRMLDLMDWLEVDEGLWLELSW